LRRHFRLRTTKRTAATRLTRLANRLSRNSSADLLPIAPKDRPCWAQNPLCQSPCSSLFSLLPPIPVAGTSLPVVMRSSCATTWIVGATVRALLYFGGNWRRSQRPMKITLAILWCFPMMAGTVTVRWNINVTSKYDYAAGQYDSSFVPFNGDGAIAYTNHSHQ
jgi:hypothetical protein